MFCNCDNNNNDLTAPKFRHVYGNVLKLAIPLTLRTVEIVENEGNQVIEHTDTDFIPSSDYPVRMVFTMNKTKVAIDAIMRDGNVAYIEDKGTIPVGTYALSVTCSDDNGNPYRFKQKSVLQVVDTTAEAGIETPIEYQVETWYLDAAIFLAMKGEDGVGIDDIVTESSDEIGGLNHVTIILTDGRTSTFTVMNGSGTVDQILDIASGHPVANSAVTAKFSQVDAELISLFGDVDLNGSTLRFWNKGKTQVIKTVDISPLVKDDKVTNFYLTNGQITLMTTSRTFSIPASSIFNANNYYTRSQVDRLIGEETNTKMPLIVPVTYNGSALVSRVDYGVIRNAILEDNREVVVRTGANAFFNLYDLLSDSVRFFTIEFEEDSMFLSLLTVNENNVWSGEDIPFPSGAGVDVDSTWVENSTNPVESQLVKSELDSLSESIDALYAQINPYTLSLSASSALLEYTGSAQNVTFTPTMKRGSTTITPDSVSVTCNSTTKTSSPFTFSLTNRNSYTANATATKDGTTKTASASVKVMHRMRIGFAAGYAAILADSNTKQSLKNSVSGTYTATNGNADNYLWICVDATLSVSTVKSSGFDVPMETAVATDGYKCYRSSEKIATGEMTIEIS